MNYRKGLLRLWIIWLIGWAGWFALAVFAYSGHVGMAADEWGGPVIGYGLLLPVLLAGIFYVGRWVVSGFRA